MTRVVFQTICIVGLSGCTQLLRPPEPVQTVCKAPPNERYNYITYHTAAKPMSPSCSWRVPAHVKAVFRMRVQVLLDHPNRDSEDDRYLTWRAAVATCTPLGNFQARDQAFDEILNGRPSQLFVDADSMPAALDARVRQPMDVEAMYRVIHADDPKTPETQVASE